MKQVEVKFKTPSGNETVKRINTSGAAKAAAEILCKEFNFWKMQSYEVVKEW